MQSLVACSVRFPQLNNLARSSDNFGASKRAKDGKAFLNLAEGLLVRSRPLPYGASVNNNRRSWTVPVSTKEETKSDDVLIQTIPDDSENSHGEQGPLLVNVKFVLQKKCKFGQQFAVVGEDPQFGTWDPKAALPLEWSEGDIWTTQVNVPVGKHIEYKFILKGKSEEILWQPGPNQLFDTLETDLSMVVSSPWEEKEEEVTSETGYKDEVSEVESMETTEQKNKDEILDADLKEKISLNETSGQGAVTIAAVDAGSDTPNGVFGVPINNTEDDTNGGYPTLAVSGTTDALGPSSVKQKERGAASASETM